MAERLDPSRPWLLERARLEPRGRAVVHAGLEIDFAALAARALAVAARLATLGIGPGDRVALVASASLRWVELVHATQILGAVLVPLNVKLSQNELAALADDCRPRLLAFDEAARRSIEQMPAAAAPLAIECERELDRVRPEVELVPSVIDLQAIWTILYTSGTTGAAKGALLTHGNHLASAVASRGNLGRLAGDCWLLALPPHHVGGLSILVRSVIDGSRVVLHARFDATGVDRALREDGVTLASLVPTALARVLDVADGRPYPPSLRAVLLGGGPIPPELLSRARAIRLPVLSTYGLTETCSQATTAALGEETPAGRAGRPLAGTDVRITERGPDGHGEILVRGPTVMRGYLGMPDATANALRDGWLHTGDVGRLDERGFLHVVDRRSDLIVTGGENVYPAEVEAALLAHPDVLEAGVVPLIDREWGQRVAAVVVLRAGRSLDLTALRTWLDGRLARFKQPTVLEIAAELPRTASGKLRRAALARRAEASTRAFGR